ncbi:MAG: small nuclear ribonucleoprotein [Thermoplasmata archaeon]|nr:small nuclear ribonucleoprotein [Thermoplasmata archaeon]
MFGRRASAEWDQFFIRGPRLARRMALPLDVLERSINKKMALQLKDGRVIEGKLVGYDQYMNLVLEESEEKSGETGRRLGTLVLRGNNVVTISPQ